MPRSSGCLCSSDRRGLTTVRHFARSNGSRANAFAALACRRSPATNLPLSKHWRTTRQAAALGLLPTTEIDRPAMYLLTWWTDARIEQISVLPVHQGLGVGQALLERVRAWAAERGLTAMTLTTFADVPWNAPLYLHLGFRVLDEDDVGPQLREVRDSETAHGLDPMKRVCMVRAVGG